MSDERHLLDDYFDLAGRRQEELRRTKPTDAKARVLLKNAVPVRYRGTARLLLTDMLAGRERRKARTVGGMDELKLHLGSGAEHKEGWVNIDLVGDPVEIAWDLTKPLPFDTGSATAVFQEHLLEHIPLTAGNRLMQECHRVLKSGGVLRVGVPDAGKLLMSYAGDRHYLEARHPGRPTAMLAVQELFYWHRHLTMFDAETLAFMFRATGFPDPRECSFGESKLDQPPDTERRRAQTLYMEAVKP